MKIREFYKKYTVDEDFDENSFVCVETGADSDSIFTPFKK
jgi:hypothetical protein